MSYDVHITRAPDWLLSDEIQISREEWAAAARAANLVPTRDPGYFYARAIRQDGEDPSFEWEDGAVTVTEPDEPTLTTMLELARTLGAIVQGDDAETYRLRDDGKIEVLAAK